MRRREFSEEQILTMGDDEIAKLSEAEVAHLIRTMFPFFCRYLVKIRNKDGEIVPFILNGPQLRLWHQIRDGSDKALRICILKARQLGMSTVIGAYFFWCVITKPGRAGIIVAHKEEPAAELFGKIELMYRKLPAELREALKSIRDTQKKGKKIAFGGEGEESLDTLLYVDTAGNEDIGRSQNFQMAHLSETAFYKNPGTTMYGLNQAIGKRPGTLVIHESTANGVGNYFHQMWKRANEDDGSVIPMFFPWTDDPDYAIEPPEGFKLDPSEKRLRKKFKLTMAQMYWRRLMIEDECDGDEEKFRQEYPLTPEEAFLVTGLTYYQPKALEWYEANTKLPEREGIFMVENGKAVLVDHVKGDWRIYKKPQPGRHYIVGADVAGGTAKDFSSAHVIDSETLEQVASFRGKREPEEFSRELKWIGLAYNTALIACEKNGEGRACLLKLYRELGYTRLFYHVTEESWSGNVANAYGWQTSVKTRPTMLAQSAELIRTKKVLIHDERTVQEMQSFVRIDNATRIAEAASGANDDMVFAMMIALSSEVRAQGLLKVKAATAAQYV